jgi:hypothetical protein
VHEIKDCLPHVEAKKYVLNRRPLRRYSRWTGFRAGVRFFLHSILKDVLPSNSCTEERWK